jgi:hypothetical protein
VSVDVIEANEAGEANEAVETLADGAGEAMADEARLAW